MININPNTDGIEIEGMKELDYLFKNLPAQVGTSFLVASMRKAAQPMKEEAIRNAPKRNSAKGGTLKKAIMIKREAKADLPMIIIAPQQGKGLDPDAWYARFQKFGTRGFGKRQFGRSDRTLYFSERRKRYFVRTKRYVKSYKLSGDPGKSGLPAIHFMQNAAESKKDEFFKQTRIELIKKLDRYLSKNVPKYYAH